MAVDAGVRRRSRRRAARRGVWRHETTRRARPHPHLILTVAYVDKDIVRPTLEHLEQRTGRPVAFLDVEACVLYRSPEACGYGHPGELKDLTTAFLDPGITSVNRELILEELSSADIGLQLVPDQAQAQIFIAFESAYSINPKCPCEGGRGVVSIDQ